VTGLRTYLSCLFAAEPAGALVEVRHKLPDTSKMGRSFHPVEHLAAVERAIHATAPLVDTYVGVAPRLAGRGGGKDAVERAHTLWVDCDTNEAADALRGFTPRPSIVVASGSPGALHAYWPLWPPAAAAEVERANERLALHLGADAKCAECARILRPPETFNHKGAPPALVTVRHMRPDVFTIEQVIGGLPIPIAPERRRRSGQPVSTGDALMEIDPPVYVEALTGLVPDSGGKVECPFHQDWNPSLHVYDEPGAGWYCFQCGRGGSIIDFAAALYGIEPRGGGYHQVRERIEVELRRAAAS
jgi:CHC2-type zinc finger protein/DNA primase RepB-like protein